jgi:transposase
MNLYPLAIDISKARFDVALLRPDGKLRHRVFPNTSAGFQQLSAWLTKQKALHIHACMEATGTYADALASYLHSAGHTVSVVNPAVIKAFAQSEMSRTKTDKADASLYEKEVKRKDPS